MRQTLSVLVENRAGVLARVASLFSRRGFNIDSLAVGTTRNPAVSRITICVEGDEELVDQIVKQLHKLQDVLMVRHLPPEEHFTRELVLVKVRADAARRMEILQIVSIFRAHVVDVSTATLTIEATGTTDKTGALVDMLEPYGVLEVVRAGAIAIERGERTMEPIQSKEDQTT
jgi:acetolactate synthase-1/3 small subunit